MCGRGQPTMPRSRSVPGPGSSVVRRRPRAVPLAIRRYLRLRAAKGLRRLPTIIEDPYLEDVDTEAEAVPLGSMSHDDFTEHEQREMRLLEEVKRDAWNLLRRLDVIADDEGVLFCGCARNQSRLEGSQLRRDIMVLEEARRTLKAKEDMAESTKKLCLDKLKRVRGRILGPRKSQAPVIKQPLQRGIKDDGDGLESRVVSMSPDGTFLARARPDVRDAVMESQAPSRQHAVLEANKSGDRGRRGAWLGLAAAGTAVVACIAFRAMRSR